MTNETDIKEHSRYKSFLRDIANSMKFNDDLGLFIGRTDIIFGAANYIEELERQLAEVGKEAARLNAIINSPQSDDFLRATSIEAEHQRRRWGATEDAGKTPSDWFWLVGYLAGKALHSNVMGDVEKAEHHIITTAAACHNWHQAMFGKTDMRPGVAAIKENQNEL